MIIFVIEKVAQNYYKVTHIKSGHFYFGTETVFLRTQNFYYLDEGE